MKENDNTAVLLIHCPDKPGILAAVTEFINQHKGNILYLDQYVNREEKVFFMRVEWDLTTFQIPKDKIEEYFQTLLAVRFEMNFRLYFTDVKPRMAIFVSKMSHCLYDLLARYAAGEWRVEIPLIISNHPDMEAVAKRFDIEFHYIPVNKENKSEQEKQQLEPPLDRAAARTQTAEVRAPQSRQLTLPATPVRRSAVQFARLPRLRRTPAST